jgi:hypothetical protein
MAPAGLSSDDLEGMPPMLRQGHLVDSIARSLNAAGPGGWSRLVYDVSAAGGEQEDRLRVEWPDGRTESVSAPLDVVDFCGQLRGVMYHPEGGTWFSLTVILTAGAGFDAHFNFDQEPDWKSPVDPLSYVEDLRRFPRTPQATPPWLQRRLDEAASRS